MCAFRNRREFLLAAVTWCSGTAVLTMLATAAPPPVLRIGITPKLIDDRPETKQSLSRDTLAMYIRSEIGLENAVSRIPDYQELAEQLDKGAMHIGVFSGFEFAWAKERYPNLQPLALAINEFPNRYVHVVARRDNPAQDFAGLKGQTIAVPRIDPGYASLFVERQSLAQGKDVKEFFSRVVEADNQEVAIDDVVDGQVQAAVADRVSLNAYKRRKPGRFNQLKEVARSQGFPSPVVAYREGILDKQTLEKLQNGLINARNKQEGQALLTLSRLTGFSTPPADFDRQLSETRKSYPPLAGKPG